MTFEGLHVVALEALAGKRPAMRQKLVHGQLEAAVRDAFPVFAKVGEHEVSDTVSVLFGPYMLVDDFLDFATEAKWSFK
jgi:hypothetical protein